jgi:hypothetical protein
MESVTETIDQKEYGRLLAKATPRVIGTEEENERALGLVESLMEKGERNMTPEKDALLDPPTNLIRGGHLCFGRRAGGLQTGHFAKQEE